MKILVLAAGYGTRLETGIREDTSGTFKHLIGVPKPLVPLASKPLIDYWLDDCLTCGKFAGPQDFYVVCNGKNHFMFAEWARERSIPEENIFCDGTESNDGRLGAIADIQLMLDNYPVMMQNDLMIIGGDTLFFEDFVLANVIETFQARNDNLVLWYFTEETKKTGILETDDRSIITAALEKPDPSETVSRKACPCFYMYRSATLPLIKLYLDQCTEQKERDAPGHLLPWLCGKSPIFAYRVQGRFDIGGLESYIEANECFQARRNKKKKLKKLKMVAAAAAIAAALTAIAFVWHRRGQRKHLS
mmetsp:Transcript_10314/g.19498  ORF Transcript_10314/g.19498 Transcript_10314/m.19498 type:complete len:304 (+) Transcript_10314:38-949(+)|eukprot:CAMPEP_0175150814 /NCGR_PEP_ID=MMETSP0087-20121206/18105_1 /TAXON_ID=136419 /ORGANISM="Unknown Unknown, Strain D1" /LENGTH=303 /DNA_ID=CAMNT_0016436853 /DNA_START=38 /DNA_END=949 /DNA_ORIENTATION=-